MSIETPEKYKEFKTETLMNAVNPYPFTIENYKKFIQEKSVSIVPGLINCPRSVQRKENKPNQRPSRHTQRQKRPIDFCALARSTKNHSKNLKQWEIRNHIGKIASTSRNLVWWQMLQPNMPSCNTHSGKTENYDKYRSC